MSAHDDVEFHCSSPGVKTFVTHDYARAAEVLLGNALCSGQGTLDVCVWSEEGARHYGGDDAVESYREDPECSVFERYEIRVSSMGRIA